MAIHYDQFLKVTKGSILIDGKNREWEIIAKQVASDERQILLSIQKVGRPTLKYILTISLDKKGLDKVLDRDGHDCAMFNNSARVK